MTDTALAIFEAHAASYGDDVRRRLIPPFDAFYGTAVAALAHADGQIERVLDLGAGTGLLSARVAAAYPEARLVLVDGAPSMLEQARERIGGEERIELHVGDLRDPFPSPPARVGPAAGGAVSGGGASGGGAPGGAEADDRSDAADGAESGGYDAIVSALAIHHLDDAGKRDLFRRVHDALRPGGVFVNAEQVLGSTPRLQERYRAWHRATSAALGCTAEEWAASEQRMALDRWATVEDQLRWLADAGFEDPDAPMRDHCFAVLVATKPG